MMQLYASCSLIVITAWAFILDDPKLIARPLREQLYHVVFLVAIEFIAMTIQLQIFAARPANIDFSDSSTRTSAEEPPASRDDDPDAFAPTHRAD